MLHGLSLTAVSTPSPAKSSVTQSSEAYGAPTAPEQELLSVVPISLTLSLKKKKPPPKKNPPKQWHRHKNISFPFLAAVCDCAFAFFGGSGTSRGNQCFVTGDQSARSHLPTFGAILIKANWAGRFIGLEKNKPGTARKGTGDLVGVLVVVLT